MHESLSLWLVETGNLISDTIETRNASYETVNRSRGTLLQRERIINCLRLQPQGYSNQELEQELGMRISSVTARINELRKQGLIESAGARINNNTGKLNVAWILKEVRG
jgi:predicted HTH transcriptional regulator